MSEPDRAASAPLMVPAHRAADLAGISRQRLWYWEKKGVVRPSVRRDLTPRAIVRLYGVDALTELLVAAEVRRVRGMTLQHLRRVIAMLRELGHDRPLRELRFAIVGSEILFQDETGAWYGERAPRQVVEPRVLRLDPIRASAARLIASGRQDQESGHVVKSRGVLGSTPVFAGTRIPVSAIFEYLDAAASPTEILEDYPALTGADLDKAVKLRRAVKQLKKGAGIGELVESLPDLTREELRSAQVLARSA